MRLSREEQHALDAAPIGRAPAMPSMSFDEFLCTAPHSKECDCGECPRECEYCSHDFTPVDGATFCDACSCWICGKTAQLVTRNPRTGDGEPTCRACDLDPHQACKGCGQCAP